MSIPVTTLAATVPPPFSERTGLVRGLRVRHYVFGLALLAQFMLGMTVNLFVRIPAIHPGANPPEYFSGLLPGIGWAALHGGPWLGAHVVLGLTLVAGSLVLLWPAIGSRDRGTLWVISLAAASIVSAAFNGGSFVNYGHDFSSMIMAASFALALGCHISGLFLTARN